MAYKSGRGNDEVVLNTQLLELVEQAGRASSEARWHDAEQLWQRVRQLDPANVQALYSLGVHAYQQGRAQEALALLAAARQAAPRDPMIPLTVAVVHRGVDQLEQEWQAIGASLVVDPCFLPALLAKGEFLERRGRTSAAADVFRNALKVAPAEPQWPPALQRRLQHARDAVAEDADALTDYLRHRVGSPSRDDLALAPQWEEAISILAGRSAPYLSQCNKLHVPRLPALTFFDPDHFPWIDDLQAMTDAVEAEFREVAASAQAGFRPYVAYRADEPVNQWQELNHSPRWNSFHLWAQGRSVEEHLGRCPRTAQALALVDRVEIAGLCPNAMFSVLAPGTRIPPHTGETNARLVAHLPLIVPPDCSFRVGYDWRRWERGKVLVFDDTIEHEARNDSDQQRVVLIFDVWNPLLSLGERQMVAELNEALGEFKSRQG
jgi:aspartyl/asparaginyl beta-hydroxylase (cupin superfamily)